MRLSETVATEAMVATDVAQDRRVSAATLAIALGASVARQVPVARVARVARMEHQARLAQMECA